MPDPKQIPIQPVDEPIICSPYEEPRDHWLYDTETGFASRAGMRRDAGYWYKTEKTGKAQTKLFTEEERDDLTLANLLREDVRRWRDADYRGASNVTRTLLGYWRDIGNGKIKLDRRLFFCQREAVETIIYLAEIRIPGRSSRTQFKNFALTDFKLKQMLQGLRPEFSLKEQDFYQTLVDKPFDESLKPLTRLGCKMATGSGKTVVMAMLITWAFCNRAFNPNSREYPNGVLICCPNLTVRERLEVLKPERKDNYYYEFGLVPPKYGNAIKSGKVAIINWHKLLPESEHKENDSTFRVVDKGAEPEDVFAERVLGELKDRMPVLVLNDEGHHCWRPRSVEKKEKLEKDEKKDVEEERAEATVWIDGLDRINNGFGDGNGIRYCIDLSATPFYIKGSGYPEGRPFPWIVSDFGLVDAIESGIVKIPRLPVRDPTGRPDPKYFKLWESIKDEMEPGEFLPGRGKRPKPEAVYTRTQPALVQIAGQWIERFEYYKEQKPGQDFIPPVLIIVCDNTDVAELFYQKISGQREEEIVTLEDVEEVEAGDENEAKPEEEATTKNKSKRKKSKTCTVYGRGEVFPDYFSNSAMVKHTERIDTKLLAEAEGNGKGGSKKDAAEALRKVISTVGKKGEPGEHVRCVVAVAMLNEGWDANNVTNILGIRAFQSQLLCEQVVGRGLRRMDYDPEPDTGRLSPEYVDVYGIPFSVIPYRGRPVTKKQPEDRPPTHIQTMDERSHMEIRFPVVEGYMFELKRNLIRCDVDELEPLLIEPNREPTATFVQATVGYKEGHASRYFGIGEFVEQDREAYYRQNHLQTIMFQITLRIMDQLTGNGTHSTNAKSRVLRLQSRHQLFPQIYSFVQDYVERKVNFQSAHHCELGLERYITRIVERIRDGIEPDSEQGEPALLPILNRYKPIGTSAEVDFKTTRPCVPTMKSHVNHVVCDTQTWEQTAAFKLEQAENRDVVEYYVRNDHLGLVIPYEFQDVPGYNYIPDYLVKLKSGVTLVLEIKGYEDEHTRAKHSGARKWVRAVNHWGRLGRWDFYVCRNPLKLGEELGDHKRESV